MENTSVTLACVQCQQRKVKCDKRSPCGLCSTAKLSCVAVQRPRRPRGRRGAADGRNADMKARVTRLEALVRSLESSNEFTGTPLNDRSPHVSSLDVSTDIKSENHLLRHDLLFSNSDLSPGYGAEAKPFVASSFWTTLSDEVVGLREILDGCSDDEVDAATVVDSPTSQDHGAINVVANPLFSSGLSPMDLESSSAMFDKMSPELLDIYRDRVDTIFKVGHWPSTLALLQRHDTSFDTKPISALRSAIRFLAFCTLSEDECRRNLLLEKTASVRITRQLTEHHLTLADVLSTTDITVLQAFVIYLAALRTCESSRASWSLVALAVRVATAMGINARPASNLAPRDREIRKRLWHTIGLLDMQTALDRGSKPLLSVDEFLDPPLMVNDYSLIDQWDGKPYKISHFTDMTFCSMTYEAMNLSRKICYRSTTLESERADLEDNLRSLHDFKLKFQVEYVTSTSQKHIGIFTRLVADLVIVTVELLFRRPLHKPHLSKRDASDTFDVLRVATEVLEGGELIVANTAFQKWQWFSWLKWFALAIVLAELCGRTSTTEIDRGWKAVDACFARYSREIADSAGGMLWKPILKLYNRAMKERRGSARLCGCGSIHNEPSMYCSQLYDEPTSGQVNNQMTHLELNQTIPEIYLASTQDDRSSKPHSQTWLQTKPVDEIQSAAELEAEALSWINWETFVEDMNKTATYADLMMEF